jgi:hypothetical protein
VSALLNYSRTSAIDIRYEGSQSMTSLDLRLCEIKERVLRRIQPRAAPRENVLLHASRNEISPIDIEEVEDSNQITSLSKSATISSIFLRIFVFNLY